MGTAPVADGSPVQGFDGGCVPAVTHFGIEWLAWGRHQDANDQLEEVKMSRSLNKVILIGNLGKDPEVRSTTGGSRVAEFSLATGRSWSGANGEKQEKTEWHRCIAWNGKGAGQQLADVVEKYMKKGDKCYVEGSIEYRQWQDKDGQTRYMTEIKVRELIMLGGGRGGDSDSESAPSRGRAEKPAKAAAASGSAAGGDDFKDFPGALEDEDDDLPF